MSENQFAPGLTQQQSDRLQDRMNMVLRLLNGDPPPLVLDTLLSTYATVSSGLGRAREGAHMLRLAAGILEVNTTPEALQKAVNDVPAAVLKVPMPERPPGPLPEGYADEDVARIEALVKAILDLVEGDKGHNALSALVTCYSQVADHLGETSKAGRVLLATGGRMVARASDGQQQADAAAPVPTTNAKLH